MKMSSAFPLPREALCAGKRSFNGKLEAVDPCFSIEGLVRRERLRVKA